MKIKGKCEGCKKNKWFVRKRKITIPVGGTATSHDLICGTCYRALKKELCQKK